MKIHGSCYIDLNLKCFCIHIGAQKLARIRENSNFFRSKLQKMGFEVLGDNDSPVMPIMVYNPAKVSSFSRECLKQNVCAPGLTPYLMIKVFVTNFN